MFKSGLPLFTFLLLFSTTAAQPYKATENFLLDCGSSASTPTSGGRRWDGDESSKFISPNSLITTSFPSQASTQDPSVNQPQYTTARIFNSSSFTYRFPVSEGPKFLRLFFYPTTYSDLNAYHSFFSATSNGYSLLTNFSASMTASFLKEASFFKEFIIYVKDTQFLNVTFTPSPNSFAFINGIEIVSMPENLYFRGNNMKYVGITSGPGIDNYTALENLYRINVGGLQISDTQDTGMYRSWNGDDNYLFPINDVGFTRSIQTPITYSTDTPNYTAPELVYQTQRSIGNLSIYYYNFTWLLPVDSGFYYVIRLHFCSIIKQYTSKGEVIFKIFINHQTAEEYADLFEWTPGSGYAVFKDYGVFVGDSGNLGSKPELWIDLQPNDHSISYLDGFLNGIEVFKISMEGDLSSPNPESSSTTPPPPTSLTPTVKPNKKKTPYGLIAGGVAGGLVLLSILVLIILRQRRRVTTRKRGLQYGYSG